MKVMGIPNCGTYKKALKWFDDHKIHYDTVNFKEEKLKVEDIKNYHLLSGYELKKFFNTSGKLYRDLNLKEKQVKMTDEEIYSLLADNPMLIKRPLVVDGGYVRVGFKESEYIEQWLNKK